MRLKLYGNNRRHSFVPEFPFNPRTGRYECPVCCAAANTFDAQLCAFFCGSDGRCCLTPRQAGSETYYQSQTQEESAEY